MSEIITQALEVIEKKDGFTKRELMEIQTYTEEIGRVTLPPHIAEKIYDHYLNGASFAELAKRFPEYDKKAILYTGYHYDWPKIRDDFFLTVQDHMKQKVMHSKFIQLELVSNMIQVAYLEANQAMMAFIKYPTEKNLPKTLRIKTIKELQCAIDMMSSIIGQENNKNINITGKVETVEAKDEQNKYLTNDIAAELLKHITDGMIKVREKEKNGK